MREPLAGLVEGRVAGDYRVEGDEDLLHAEGGEQGRAVPCSEHDVRGDQAAGANVRSTFGSGRIDESHLGMGASVELTSGDRSRRSDWPKNQDDGYYKDGQ